MHPLASSQYTSSSCFFSATSEKLRGPVLLERTQPFQRPHYLGLHLGLNCGWCFAAVHSWILVFLFLMYLWFSGYWLSGNNELFWQVSGLAFRISHWSNPSLQWLSSQFQLVPWLIREVGSSGYSLIHWLRKDEVLDVLCCQSMWRQLANMLTSPQH